VPFKTGVAGAASAIVPVVQLVVNTIWLYYATIFCVGASALSTCLQKAYANTLSKYTAALVFQDKFVIGPTIEAWIQLVVKL